MSVRKKERKKESEKEREKERERESMCRVEEMENKNVVQ